MTKPATPEGDMFTLEARAHLYRLKEECVSLELWAAGELSTYDPGERDSITEWYGITLPGSLGDISLYIARGDGTYRLFACDDNGGGDTVLAEGPAIEDVTKRWAWVLDRQEGANVVAFPLRHDDAGRLALTSG